MQITLRVDGKFKEFHQDFISGRMFRRTIEMQKLFRTNESGKNVIDETHIDTLVMYVVELFDKNFTVDQFYDGIESKKLISTVMDCIQHVISQSTEAVGETDPN